MSSAVVSTSAASGRLFIFDDIPDAHGGTAALGCSVEPSSTAWKSTVRNQPSKIPPGSVLPASRLEIRPAPEMASSGIPALDALTGGLPRGCLTELCGPASSGRTTVLLAALTAATRRGEYCAVIDASDALDPHSAAAAGIDFDCLLWVRCDGNSPQRHRDPERKSLNKVELPNTHDAGYLILNSAPFSEFRVGVSPQAAMQLMSTPAAEHRLEQALRATDLLLESGGFGLIVLDLADLPPQSARRISLTTWFRFRRAVEHKPTILLAIEQHPIAGSCSSLQLQLKAAERRKSAAHGPSASLRVNSSRGFGAEDEQVPEERKKIHHVEQPSMDRESVHPPHAHLLTGLTIDVELTHSRLERKPARSIAFETKTAWAG